MVKTESPYKSHGHGFNWEITIDTNRIINDSLDVGAGDPHEGGDFVLEFRNGTHANSLTTNIVCYDTTNHYENSNYVELSYALKNSDTSLWLNEYTSDNRLVDQTQYIRALRKPNDSTFKVDGISYLVNKNLISGVYRGQDTSGKAIEVRFDDYGNVFGFSDFRGYYVNTDFMGGPENNLDQIYFDLQTKNQRVYAFVITADTLNLFETKDNEDSTLLLRSDLKFKLIRQRSLSNSK